MTLSERFDRWMARHRLAYASLVVLAACIVSILFVDLPLSIWLQTGAWRDLDPLFHWIGEMGRAEGWVAFALVVYLWVNWRRRRLVQGPEAEWCRWLTRHINLLFLTLILSTPIIHLLKNGVARFRPKLWYGEGEYGFGWPFVEGYPADAFPSGHTQTAFAVAAAIALLAPRWRHAAYLLAGLVGLSRLVNAAHYLSDVIAGAFIALAVAFALRPILLDPTRRWPGETMLEWLPLLRRRRQAKASPASTRA